MNPPDDSAPSHSADPSHDALVIGAGPAGAAITILLARAGWSVALVEKQPFPRRKVCGECIAASNLPLLDALGIGTAFAQAAGPALRRVALLRGGQAVEAPLPAAADARHPWGRALGRERLDTLLLDAARAAGAQVLQPWAVQALDGGPGAWSCVLRAVDPDAGAASTAAARTARLGARVTIAAHGSWERLPSERALRRELRGPSDLLAFKANFRDVALAPGILPVLAFAGGYGGMVVEGDDEDGTLATLACCIRRDRLDAVRRAQPGLRAGDAVEAMLRAELAGVADALRSAQREGPWLAAGPLDPGVHLRADDGLLRVGNAAGEAHPILGEGLSMALQSAFLLADELVAARASSARVWSSTLSPGPRSAATAQAGALRDVSSVPDAAAQRTIARRYASAWKRRFRLRLAVAALFAHAAMHPVAGAALMALCARWPGLLTWGARRGGKVACAADPATIARLAIGAAPVREQGRR
jgi:2-polyprenyl-6-methoxyphenol hydroxylase-like FAD-dependent oxidoreductase